MYLSLTLYGKIMLMPFSDNMEGNTIHQVPFGIKGGNVTYSLLLYKVKASSRSPVGNTDITNLETPCHEMLAKRDLLPLVHKF